MLSDLFSWDISQPRGIASPPPLLLLWFAFRFVLWDISNSSPIHICNGSRSCDLLSDLFFEILATAKVPCWLVISCVFAFRFVLWDISNKALFLSILPISNCCDLLSDLFFEIIYSEEAECFHTYCMLWFALRLSFEILATAISSGKYPYPCCDLLSDLFFEDISNSSSGIFNLHKEALWFAFRFVLWDISISSIEVHLQWSYRCDLLSDLFFEILATAESQQHNTYEKGLWFAFRFVLWDISNSQAFLYLRVLLWFAFRFVLWDISNSLFGLVEWIKSVVICFQICSLRY